MSQHEFDAYLALLGGMLGLSDEQREAISGELHDHMQQRLEDLIARGVPRDEAIHRALSEIGDASRLASGLVAAANLERRKRIMRWTFGSIATCGLLFFVALAYWPAGENGIGPASTTAQEDDDTKDDAQTIVANGGRGSVDPNEKVFAALAKPVTIETTQPTTLTQVIEQIADQVGIQVIGYVPGEEGDETMKALTSNVDVRLRDIPAMTALRTAASRKGEVGFTLNEGLLHVVGPVDEENALLVRFYEVSDLLTVNENACDLPHQHASLGLAAKVRERRKAILDGETEETIAKLERAIVAEADVFVRSMPDPQSSLIEFLTGMVDADQWEHVGGPGSMSLFGNSLVVSAPLSVHWKVERTLLRLRGVLRTNNRDTKTSSARQRGGTTAPR